MTARIAVVITCHVCKNEVVVDSNDYKSARGIAMNKYGWMRKNRIDYCAECRPFPQLGLYRHEGQVYRVYRNGKRTEALRLAPEGWVPTAMLFELGREERMSASEAAYYDPDLPRIRPRPDPVTHAVVKNHARCGKPGAEGPCKAAPPCPIHLPERQ